MKRAAQKEYNVEKHIVDIGKWVEYFCQEGFKLLNETDDISEADGSLKAVCNETGDFVYPNPWPTCEETVNCTDPGITEDLKTTENHATYTDHAYKAELKYECIDKRKFAKVDGDTGPNGELQQSIISKCLWRKVYDILGPSIVCEIHHCAHPHNDDGNHTAPLPELNINLVESQEVIASHVPFQENIMYKCDENMFIENRERDPTQNNITVQCLETGLYNIPEEWPNCTETVSCGPPPTTPINGSIIWLNGTENEVRISQLFVKYFFINHHATTRLKRGFYLKYISRRQPFEFKVENFQPKFFLVI